MSTIQTPAGSGNNPYKHLTPVLICLALAFLTVVAFWPVQDAGFINLDDDVYVYENAYLQSGLNRDSIQQAFSFELAKKSGHWQPVTWLSWLLDYSLFGLDPFGYHLVNLLFHLANTILLFLILRRMTRTLWPSAFVAALFAIHPLHVESVAWITERKDVLSTFFMMLTLGAYSYYVEHRDFKRYVFVLLFFILGLMSKSMLVTLPFVLLLLDYWPLGRLSEAKPGQKIQTEILKPVVSDRRKNKPGKKNPEKTAVKQTGIVPKPAEPEFRWSKIYPLFLEKVPLFILAALSSVTAFIAAQKNGTVESIEALSPVVRIGNAFISYAVYIGKMILPINLAVLYPHPGGVILWQVLAAAILLVAVTLIVIWKVKQLPYLATGWLWYLGTLVPVIGIVQVGPQAMADRYTYISLIGLFIMVAWGIPDLLKKVNYRKEILLAASAAVIFCFSILTWKQSGYWQNSIALYDHTLKATENNSQIHHNRGSAHYTAGDYKQAAEDYSRAIEIKPAYGKAYHNRGAANIALGNYQQAIADFSKAIEIKPDYEEAYSNRGNVYCKTGNYKQAMEDMNRSIAINPANAGAYYNRGVVSYMLGNYRQAVEDFTRAIEIKSRYVMAYNNRGNTYHALGNYAKAIEDYSRAIELKPDFAGAYNNRGIAYGGMGNKERAIEDLKTAAKMGDERAKNVLKNQKINW